MAAGIDDTISCLGGLLGGFLLVYGLCSLVFKEKLYISEAVVAVLCGILVGPYGIGLIHIEDEQFQQDFTRQFSRIVIAIQVMAVGISLPKRYLRTEWQSLCVLLIPVMSWMWMLSAFCVWFAIPGLTFLESLMISSCFTPTDPVLANSIVHGHFAEKYVPAKVRHIISAESGANDGLGYPFLFLATNLIQMSKTDALWDWSIKVMLYEILFSIVVGFAVGYVARKLLRLARERKMIDNESFLVYSVALALFVMGAVALIGSDDLLACFIAGNSFTWDGWFRMETESFRTMEVFEMLLNVNIFIYIGAIMPWSSFVNPDLGLSVPRLLLLAVAVLIFRRLPIVVALYKLIPAISNWHEAVFAGWFGPMGVGSVFYSTVALANFSPDGPNAMARQLIEPIVYFIVLSSIVAHGASVPLFTVTRHAKQCFQENQSSTQYTRDVSTPVSTTSTYGSLPIYHTPHSEP